MILRSPFVWTINNPAGRCFRKAIPAIGQPYTITNIAETPVAATARLHATTTTTMQTLAQLPPHQVQKLFQPLVNHLPSQQLLKHLSQQQHGYPLKTPPLQHLDNLQQMLLQEQLQLVTISCCDDIL